MKKYILNIDYANGFVPNTQNKTPNFLFKKGDAVVGEITQKYVFNKNVAGIFAKPTVEGGYINTPDGLAFIPMEYLTETISPTQKVAQTVAAELENPKKTDIIGTIVLGLLIIGFIKLILTPNTK